MRIIAILFIFSLISCDSKWKTTPVNKFLSEKNIDTTQYKTYEELFSQKKINRIITSNHNENVHIYKPLVLENKFVFIEKKLNSDDKKLVFLKIDKDGETIDSLVISRYYSIIDDYLVDKNSYCSWFIDNDKKIKPLKNIDYFSKSDSTNIKSLVNKINKNNLKFHSTSEYDMHRIDTCNYIILFKNGILEKYNFSKTINLEEYLGTKKTIYQDDFSSRFEILNSINTEELFEYDNFYAHSYDEQIREGIGAGDLFSNTGGTSISYCNSYYGTCFITLQNKSNLKLKLMNEQICESEEPYKYTEATVYTESFLNFYLTRSDVYHYYIVKK